MLIPGSVVSGGSRWDEGQGEKHVRDAGDDVIGSGAGSVLHARCSEKSV